MQHFIAAARYIRSGRFFTSWFHKRNVIIVSEHKVKHIGFSARAQFGALTLIIGAVVWASYSTGSYMAARSTLKAQGQTIRSVTNARIDTNFNADLGMASLIQPASEASRGAPTKASLSDPSFALSGLDNNKLYARIAFLEYKVSELKSANDAIVARVRDKTSGQLDNLEAIIKQTGLNPDDIRKQANDSKLRTHSAKAEGGPYIPAGPIALSTGESSLYKELDDLAALRQVVSNLPLAQPIQNAEQESPFGHRIDPINGHLAFHSGLDLAGPAGSKIMSPAEGKVISAGISGAYGNCIDIDHGFGIVTRYGHLSEILVHEGQVIHKGDVIGIQGSTGRSTGAHLHYEVRYHDQPMNPVNFLEAGRYVSQN